MMIDVVQTGAADVPPEHAATSHGAGQPGGHESEAVIPGDGATRPSRWAVATLWCVVFVVRWAYAADRQVYHLGPDEPATLGMARWLSGTGDWTMLQAATWRPGLATLLAPAFWLFDDPASLHRAALVLNAAIGACGALLLVHLVRRLTVLSAREALLVSGAIALLPASLSASAYAWAEPLVTVSFLAGALCVFHYWDELRLRSAFGAVAAATVGVTSHGRMLPFVVLVAAALGVRAVSHRRPTDAVAILVATATSTAASMLYTGFVIGNVWTQPADTNTAGSTLARLGRPLAIADAAAGQLWYLLVSTIGIAGVGTFVVVRNAIGSSLRAPSLVDARLLLFLTVPLIGVSMLFMADRPRADHLVYGRYNDAIVWPILAIGVAWLIHGVRTESRRTVAWLAGVIVVVTAELGFLLQQLHSTRLAESRAEFGMIAGIRALSGSMSEIRVLRVTAIAGVLIVLTFMLSVWSRVPRWALGLTCAVIMSVAGLETRDLGPRLNSGTDALEVAAIESIVPADDVLGARFTPDALAPNVAPRVQLNHILLFQWYLPDRSFVEDFGNDDDVGPYVFAPSNDALMEVSGGTIVWDDPGSNMALWREPDPAP